MSDLSERTPPARAADDGDRYHPDAEHGDPDGGDPGDRGGDPGDPGRGVDEGAPASADRTARPGLPRPALAVGLVVAALAVVGFDLRTAVTSVSAALPEIHRGLHAPALFNGVVSSLAPLVFAAAGLVAPPLLRRLGIARGLLAALVLTTVGLVARAAAPDAVAFVALAVPTLAGLGVANVAMPALVKEYLPGRIGIGTTVYTAMLAIGTATAAALTVPIAQAAGGWRTGLGIWALPLVGGIVCCAPLVRARAAQSGAAPAGSSRTAVSRTAAARTAASRTAAAAPAPPSGAPDPSASGGTARSPITVRSVARTRLGWAVAVLMAGQSASSYLMFAYLPSIATDHGFSLGAGGLLLSVFSLLGVTASVLPVTLGHLQDHRLVIVVLSLCWVAGDLGLAAAPGAAWLWVVLLGVGSSLFTVGLLLIPMRTATVTGTAALSGFALAFAYVVSAAVVFVAGAVRAATGSWVPVLLSMVVLMMAVVAAGFVAGRPGTVEGTLHPPAPAAG